ncbi:hypothetical protein B0H19DRAFT_924454, partial [Mycena capillaripes]
LDRSGSNGGGARAVAYYSETLFKAEFRDLSKRQQELVYAAQQHDHTWRNDITPGIMGSFATGATPCLKNVEVDAREADAPPPCESCLLVFKSRPYQKIINKPQPASENLRFVPQKHQNPHAGQLFAKFHGLEALFSEKNEFTVERRYVEHVLQGNFKNDSVFSGIIQAKVLAKDRETSGRGNQNFKHNEDVDAIFGLIYAISPRAYREISKHIPLRSERSLK